MRIQRFGSFLALASLTVFTAPPARADFFGGDLPLLAEIVANTLQELGQLRMILGNGQDTLGFLRDVNSGIREAMTLMQTMNRTIQPGALSEYQNANDMLHAIQDLYGTVPETAEARRETFTDQGVSEAVTTHNQAFSYADQVDPEAERIKDYSHGVSPLGAERLTAESIGVLIHVSNQILRTNAAMLKIMSEQLALQNHHEKVGSEQFQMQYTGLSQAIGTAPSMKDASTLQP